MSAKRGGLMAVTGLSHEWRTVVAMKRSAGRYGAEGLIERGGVDAVRFPTIGGFA